MAKRSAKAPAVYIEPEDESQDVEEDEPEVEQGAAEGGKVSKVDAVRAALDAGMKKPGEGVEYVMEHFGIELSKPHFSAIKTGYKKAGGLKERGKPGRPPKAAVEAPAAPAPAKERASGDGDLLDVMLSMKPLISQFGAEKLKKMVDLLG